MTRARLLSELSGPPTLADPGLSQATFNQRAWLIKSKGEEHA